MENSHKKKFIFVCTSKDCKQNGSKNLEKIISGMIKEAGVKSAVEVIKTKCMGYCKKGPNVIVDNALYHKVKEKDLEGLLSLDNLDVNQS